MSSNDYLVKTLVPADERAPATALANVDRTGVSGADPITISETVQGYIVLRVRPDNTDMRTVAANTIGMELPGTLLSVSEDNRCLRWISPDEFLLSLPTADTAAAEASLRSALDETCAVVDNSAGYVTATLTGDSAEMVIRKSTGYDIDEANFATGKVVTTTFAHAQMIMRRLDTNRFELVFRRSFADYVWRWLRECCNEFGLDAS